MNLITAAIGGAILAVIAGALSAHPAKAQQQIICGSYENFAKAAYEQYGELPAFIAVSPTGTVLTFLVNPTTGSWTMLSQGTADVACAVLGGESWGEAPAAVHDAPKLKAGKGA